MSNYQYGSVFKSVTKEATYNRELRDYLVAIYKYIAFALAITGLVAIAAASSTTFMTLLFGTSLKWIVIFAPVVMSMFIGMRITDLSLDAARLSLGIFAALMGLSLSSIFLIFTGESISRVFFIAASLFGTSLYGYTTKKDLASIGSFMIMGLIGILITSLVNIFLASNAMQFVISIAGVIIFTGLTAFDTQRIKESYSQLSHQKDVLGNLAVYGALMLYMDFINLFIMLLQLLGVKRDE